MNSYDISKKIHLSSIKINRIPIEVLIQDNGVNFAEDYWNLWINKNTIKMLELYYLSKIYKLVNTNNIPYEYNILNYVEEYFYLYENVSCIKLTKNENVEKNTGIQVITTLNPTDSLTELMIYNNILLGTDTILEVFKDSKIIKSVYMGNQLNKKRLLVYDQFSFVEFEELGFPTLNKFNNLFDIVYTFRYNKLLAEWIKSNGKHYLYHQNNLRF